MSEITKLVSEAVVPIIEEQGCELVDLEYVKEKDQYYLRFYVDQPGGIDIEKIAALSELVSQKLDSLDPDPFPDPYILELSSPGLERPIKTALDWELAKGQYIHVSLYQKIADNKAYEGKMLAYDETQVTLEIKIKTRHKKLIIPRRSIANIRFAIEL